MHICRAVGNGKAGKALTLPDFFLLNKFLLMRNKQYNSVKKLTVIVTRNHKWIAIASIQTSREHQTYFSEETETIRITSLLSSPYPLTETDQEHDRRYRTE